MKQRPLVGIVVCTHERAEQLRRVLAIVKGQTYQNHVVTVIDDASQCTNDNRRICAEYTHPIEYRFNTIRSGITRSRNIGLRHLMESFQPDLVCMLDDDDYWPPNRLEIGVRAMSTGVGMSFGIQCMADSNLRPIIRFPCNTDFNRLRIHAVCFGEFFFPAKTYLFDAQFLNELRLGPAIWYCDGIAREDIELGARALRHVHRHRRWRAVYIRQLLACWIQDSSLKKFNSREYRQRQLESHKILAREYLPQWLQGFAISTAPYTFNLPRCVKFSLL